MSSLKSKITKILNNITKKQIITSVGILLAAMVLFTAYTVAFSMFAQRADAQSTSGSAFSPSQRYYLTAGTGSATESGEISATTTDIFMSTAATASSTIQGQLNRGDQINLFVRGLASSSAANLNWVVETSENNIDWYPVDSATSTTDLQQVVNVGDTKYNWGLATSTDSNCATNTVCKHVTIGQDLYANYFRIRFGITGANAAVHAFAHIRETVGR